MVIAKTSIKVTTARLALAAKEPELSCPNNQSNTDYIPAQPAVQDFVKSAVQGFRQAIKALQSAEVLRKNRLMKQAISSQARTICERVIPFVFRELPDLNTVKRRTADCIEWCISTRLFCKCVSKITDHWGLRKCMKKHPIKRDTSI